MPSTIQEPASTILPVLTSGSRIEPAGSASTISVLGDDLREEAAEAGQRAAGADAHHHRVHVAAPSARQISGPVVVSCASGLAGLANWLT